MSDLVLYNYFRSSTSYRVRIALHWKHLPFEYKAVHLLQDGGQQHNANYRNLNPMREVPTLIHQGHAIYQSMAITEYLDEVFPNRPLFPQRPIERAYVRQICENMNSGLHPVGNLKMLQYLTSPLCVSETQKLTYLAHWYERGLEATEKTLEKTSAMYCVGGQVTAADMFLIPQLTTCERFGYNFRKFPIMSAIFDRCIQLEEFKKAHPFRQQDTPSELRIN